MINKDMEMLERLFIALFGVGALLAAIFYLERLWNKGVERERAEKLVLDGENLHRMPRSVIWLSVVLALFMSAAALLAPDSYEIPLLIGLGSFLLAGQWTLTSFRSSSAGIRRIGVFRQTSLKWNEIREIRTQWWRPTSLLIESNSGGRIRVPFELTSWKEFAKCALANLSAHQFDTEARSILQNAAEGRLPDLDGRTDLTDTDSSDGTD